MKVHNIEVVVKYRVSLLDVDVPPKVAKQLKTVFKKAWVIEDDAFYSEDFEDASEWVRENVRQSQCLEMAYLVANFVEEGKSCG